MEGIETLRISFNKEKFILEAIMILRDLILNKNIVEAVVNSFYFVDMYFNKDDLPYILYYNETKWYYNEINYAMLLNIEEFDKENLMKYSENIPDIIIEPEHIKKRFDIINYSKEKVNSLTD
jgi:hypothetical protein